MSNRKWSWLAGVTVVVAASLVMVGCGSAGSTSRNPFQTPTGSVVTFGTDQPVCDVESFIATITSASLVPQSGGQAVSLITSTAPETVDFARLADFTNILSTVNVAAGTYSQLQVSLTNPQLIALNTATSPPTPVTVSASLTSTSLTININPPLVVTGSVTSGLLFDFNLGQSLQVGSTGQVTGVVDPQITVTATTTSGTTVGEADALYGILQSPTTSNLPSGFTGSFGLALQDGTGQTLTIYTDSNTVLEGDGVSSFGNLQAGTFVEVDATVSTSGQIAALIVDSEEPVSSANQQSAFLGKIIAVSPRDSYGNATSFTLLVDDEIPSLSGSVPLHSALNVTLASTTNYFSNWEPWNLQRFAFDPATLGLAERVAVFGTLTSGSPPSLTASQVFLRPRTVSGNFSTLLAAGSDGVSGGFTMIPCGGLFAGNPVTVLTYPTTILTNVSGLTSLTPTSTVNSRGLLFYAQTNGASSYGASWTAPTWVLEAKQVLQPTN